MEPGQAAGGRFRIGDIEVRPDLNRLATPSGEVSLEPKIMRVLARLAERPGEVVTKEVLLRDVWNGTFVTEDVLTRAVGEIRKVFGDDPGNPRVIETIRKRGYRLIAPVERPGATSASAQFERRRPAAPLPARAAAVAAAAAAVGVVVFAAIRFGREAPGPRARSASMRILPFSDLPGNELDPAVSPDGRRVAFAWSGGQGDRPRIYVRLRNSDAPVRLTSGPGEDRAPAWSPDGRRIAFVRFSGSGCAILLVPSEGGAPERSVAPCGDPDHARLAWSADGEHLARSRSAAPGGPDRIELVALAGGAVRAVTSPPDGIVGDFDPAVSPDGSSVAFVRSLAESVADVYVAPLSGGDASRLTFDNGDLEGVAWSPDGGAIVFSSNRGGIYSLWSVRVGGGEPRFVAGGGTKIKHPSTGAAANVIVYESWVYDVNLWEAPASGGGTAPRPLTATSDEWNYAPAYSSDGSRIAFISTRSGRPEIWTMRRDGSAAARVAALGSAQLGRPAFSPDGRRIAFSGRPEGPADIYVAEVPAGRIRRLTSDAGDELAPSWSRDGRQIYFSSRRTGRWEVWRVPAGGGVESRVTTGGGFGARESPDGRFLYYSRLDAPGLYRMPVEGGASEPVLAHPATGEWTDWTMTRRGIFTQDEWTDDGACIRFRPFGQREHSEQAILSGLAWHGFAVSPDGATIVYPRSDRRTSDIRLIENAFP